MLSESNKTLHLFWMIGLLILAIIFLITGEFGSNKEVVNYVSFAVTIASLILAILAIFQAMISSQAFSNTTSKISDAADRLLKNEQSFFNTSEVILSQLKEVSNGIKTIDKSTGDLLKNVDTLAKSKNVKSDTAKGSESGSLGSRLKLTKEQASVFLEQASLAGLRAMYVLKLATDNNVEFTLEEIAKKEASFDVNYSFGFLVACSSLNLLDFNRGSGGVIKSKGLDEHVSGELKKIYEKRAFELDNKYPGLPKSAQSSIANLDLIFAQKKKISIDADSGVKDK